MELPSNFKEKLLEQNYEEVETQPSRNKDDPFIKFPGLIQNEKVELYLRPQPLDFNFCTANSLVSLNSSEKYKVFKCNTCKGKENICEWCYNNCHKHDDKKLTVVNEVHSNQQVCACACSNHNVDSNENEEKIQSSSSP